MKNMLKLVNIIPKTLSNPISKDSESAFKYFVDVLSKTCNFTEYRWCESDIINEKPVYLHKFPTLLSPR